MRRVLAVIGRKRYFDTRSFFFSKSYVPVDFHPGKLAEYYNSDLGQFARMRICNVWDWALHDPPLRRHLRHFFRAMGKRRIVLAGYGYAVPYLETFVRNFDSLFVRRNRRHPESSLTFSGLALIPPDSDTTSIVNGASYVRSVTHLPPRTNLVSVKALDWPFPDHTLPFLLLAHSYESCFGGERLLNEAQRVLMPGGELYIMTPHPWTLWLASGKFMYDHQKCFELKEVLFSLNRFHFDFQGFTVAGSLQPWVNGRHPVYRTGTGEIAPRKLWLRALDFLTRNWFPSFGGILLIRATRRREEGL